MTIINSKNQSFDCLITEIVRFYRVVITSDFNQRQVRFQRDNQGEHDA